MPDAFESIPHKQGNPATPADAVVLHGTYNDIKLHDRFDIPAELALLGCIARDLIDRNGTQATVPVSEIIGQALTALP